MAKQKQIKMQVQMGALAAIPQLESRTDEQLQGESSHRVAAKAILGARAAERYDAKAARAYFNEALAGAHPQERPALRQMMKASLALAERRPDELRDAMEKLGQEAPSGRQMFMLRMMGLLIPPASAGIVARIRGIVLIVVLVIVLLAVGTGIVQAIGLLFGGIGAGQLDLLRLPAGRGRARRARPARQTQAGEGPGRARGPAAALAQFSADESRRRCSRASGSSGPSSVKMRDHHAPDQVAAVRVGLAGEGALQRLERRARGRRGPRRSKASASGSGSSPRA